MKKEKAIELLQEMFDTTEDLFTSLDYIEALEFAIDFISGERIKSKIWIRAKDRLPKDNSDVLIYDINRGRHKSEYRNKIFWCPYYGQEIADEFDDVICWQPLPEPPKE